MYNILLFGQGRGRRLPAEIISLAREKGFCRIKWCVADINTKAIQLYEKPGFEKECLLKKDTWLKSERRFLDEVIMCYLL